MFMTCKHNAGRKKQKHLTTISKLWQISNISGEILTNENVIHEEMKGKFNPGKFLLPVGAELVISIPCVSHEH